MAGVVRANRCLPTLEVIDGERRSGAIPRSVVVGIDPLGEGSARSPGALEHPPRQVECRMTIGDGTGQLARQSAASERRGVDDDSPHPALVHCLQDPGTDAGRRPMRLRRGAEVVAIAALSRHDAAPISSDQVASQSHRSKAASTSSLASSRQSR